MWLFNICYSYEHVIITILFFSFLSGVIHAIWIIFFNPPVTNAPLQTV